MTSLRLVALGSVVVLALCAATVAACRPSRACIPPSDPVLVPLGKVPPDACVAYYGPGPCREHGQTVQGSTDAVALWAMPEERRFPVPTPARR